MSETGEVNPAWRQWRAAAEELARAAGVLTRRMLAAPRQVQHKGFRDVVTDADFAAQQLITDGIRQQFPHHGFWAEEENPNLPTEGPVRWLIDPIDGTSNYARGIPNYCVSIATSVEEQVVAGVIYDPMTDELFSALRGQGCTLNGQPVTVSAVNDLGDAIVALDWGRRRPVRAASATTLPRIVHRVKTLRAIGSSALTLAWVAAGRIDAHITYELGAWDIAAGQLMIREAGGSVTTATGAPLPLSARTSCVSSNRLLHETVLGLLRGIEVGEE